MSHTMSNTSDDAHIDLTYMV